jgi:hypothetical protein
VSASSDQAARWDQRRVDAYIAFASTLKDAVRVSHRLTAPYRLQVDFEIDRTAATRELDAASRQNSKDWELLLLLGDAEVVEAARRWRLAVAALVVTAQKETWDAAEWRAAVHRPDRARDDFHVAARRGLGVAGGSVAQFAYLREMHGDASLLIADALPPDHSSTST